MAGIDKFLDKVTFLPPPPDPGEWDSQIRLEPPPKVPSQANRRNTKDHTKASGAEDVVDQPFKCKHCRMSLDHPPPIKWTKRCGYNMQLDYII